MILYNHNAAIRNNDVQTYKKIQNILNDQIKF